MMKKSTALFQQLEQTVARLYTEYAGDKQKPLPAKFDRTLFSEDFQSFQFYINQIHQTLAQITYFDEQDRETLNFLSEKLLAQCTALTDALKTEPTKAKSAVNFKPVLSKREALKQALNRLPPRERLTKYYEALQALNEKLEQQTDLYRNAAQPSDKIRYAQQIEITQQRQKRCLDAIELLEEYLAFRENGEN